MRRRGELPRWGPGASGASTSAAFQQADAAGDGPKPRGHSRGRAAALPDCALHPAARPSARIRHGIPGIRAGVQWRLRAVRRNKCPAGLVRSDVSLGSTPGRLQLAPQLLNRAENAVFSGIGVNAQYAGDLIDIAAFVMPENKGGPFDVGQFFERRLEDSGDLAAFGQPLGGETRGGDPIEPALAVLARCGLHFAFVFFGPQQVETAV